MFNKSLTAILTTTLLFGCDTKPNDGSGISGSNEKPVSSFMSTSGNTLVATSTDDSNTLFYQWYINGVKVPEATGSTFDASNYVGTYIVTLETTDVEGKKDEVSKELIFNSTTSNQNPVAVATANISIGDAPLSIIFNGSESSDNEDQTLSYLWDFDDGTTSEFENPNHTFTTAGNYSVTLKVTDSNNASHTTTLIIIATQEGVDSPPFASFTTDTTSGDAPLYITFDASASNDDIGIVSYEWDFGDGSAIESGISTTHTYDTGDTYTATLTVSDISNQTTSATEIIIVESVVTDNTPPTANFTINPSGLTVSVDAQTSTDDKELTDFVWEFFNSNGALIATETGKTWNYTYAMAGSISIKLTVTDSNGLPDSITQSTTLTKPVNDNGTIIFEENYESQTVGENPDGWGVNIGYNIQLAPNATQYASTIKVVNDAPDRPGNALYVNGNNLSSSQNYSIMPLDLSKVGGVERVFVRYYIYATTNFIGNRATIPSGGQPNHNHFMSLGLSHSAEMRIGEIKGALGANEYGADDIVPKDEYWYGAIETPRMEAGTWYCVETAFLNDGASPILKTWLDEELITEINDQSDWKNGTARANWLDGFFGGVQLGWGNFGTYDNELYFDDVIASNERIGCDDSLSEPAPILTPNFDLSEDNMIVTVDASDSTGSAAFTYEWDFDGEFIDTTSGANASYTFTTAGDKSITLTLISGSTTESIEQTINIVDSTYSDLLESVSTNIVSETCIDCHISSKNKPLKFDSSTPTDVEAGIITYIQQNIATKVDEIKYTPSNTSPFTHNKGDKLLGNKQDWEDLIDMIAATLGGDGGLGNGTILIFDDFEDTAEFSLSSDWGTWLGHGQINTGNSKTDATFALVDKTVKKNGQASLHMKIGQEGVPNFIYQKIDKSSNPDAIYVRGYMFTTINIGGAIEGGFSEHVHWSALSEERQQNGSGPIWFDDTNKDIRYGTWLQNIIGGFQTKNHDSSTTAKPTHTIFANEWTCFEYAVVKDSTFDHMYGWLNDEEVFAATQANHWSNGAETGFFDEATDYVTFGWRSFNFVSGITDIWFDDLVVSTDRIGCN
ncbi:MAG: PKD domain-containing protein [Saccharospirillaceae bacterium]|nr:PKD domain-containing protein [Pseudomonadales bacterium]NRB80754.1 PKD domain-containing protein [Saccharospirillaceae bacterium]